MLIYFFKCIAFGTKGKVNALNELEDEHKEKNDIKYRFIRNFVNFTTKGRTESGAMEKMKTKICKVSYIISNKTQKQQTTAK